MDLSVCLSYHLLADIAPFEILKINLICCVIRKMWFYLEARLQTDFVSHVPSKVSFRCGKKSSHFTLLAS